MSVLVCIERDARGRRNLKSSRSSAGMSSATSVAHQKGRLSYYGEGRLRGFIFTNPHWLFVDSPVDACTLTERPDSMNTTRLPTTNPIQDI